MYSITIASCLLISIGILIIYSSSVSLAIQQFIFAVIGILFYFFLSKIDYRAVKNLIKPTYFIIIVLLILVFIIGFESRGAIRWIPIGLFNIQPSEFAKPVLILFLANFWCKNLPSWKNIFKSFFYILPLIALIFKQPDLGTTLVVGAVWIGLLYAAKISVKKLLILVLIFALILPAGWFTLQDYQKQRFVSFLSPSNDPLGIGYNLIQSTIAVGSGEALGRGLGRGTQSRLQFLPEFRTDFIFAAMAEELGFFGSMLILGLYLFLILSCIKIAQNTSDYFGFLISLGVAFMLLFQISVNVGMNIGLLPITGITLPLVSYGGSSVISTLITLGFVASVAKRRKIS